jgi:hypothetical protein
MLVTIHFINCYYQSAFHNAENQDAQNNFDSSDTQSLTFREKYKLQVFGNKQLIRWLSSGL